MTQQRKLVAVIHGESGVGKSVTADTAPAPRLILDAEGGSEFTPSWPKALWNPNAYAPPGVQGCEPGQEQVPETTRVIVRDFGTMQRVYQWLDSGQHFFESIAMDSLTEIQKRCKDTITGYGVSKMQTQDWGTLLDNMEALVRQFRDLKLHPSRPMHVFILALSDLVKDKLRPSLQGKLAINLAGFVDLIGYQSVELMGDGVTPYRRLLVQPIGPIVAKDRTHVITRTFGSAVHLRDIDHPEYGGTDLVGLIEAINQAPATAGAPVA